MTNLFCSVFVKGIVNLNNTIQIFFTSAIILAALNQKLTKNKEKRICTQDSRNFFKKTSRRKYLFETRMDFSKHIKFVTFGLP